MSLPDKKEQRGRLHTQAQALLTSANVTAEDRAKATQMLNDADVIDADIKALERIEAAQAEERSTTKPPRDKEITGGADLTKDQREAAAFKEFVTRGVSKMSAENRDLLTTTTADAYLIPQQFNTTLTDARKDTGSILNEVTLKVTNSNGAPMKFALSNDTANSFATMTEGSAVSAVDPTFSGFIVSTDTLATLIKVSIQELADSYFSLDAWLKDKIGIRYARSIDAAIINGNSSNIASLLAGVQLGATATGTSSTTGANLLSGQVGPVYHDFVTVFGNQDPMYLPNSKWAMNQATRVYLMGQTDNYGRPLFIPNPNSGALDQILGCPIVITPNLANSVNTSTSLTPTGVLFGDFQQGYTLRTDGPIAIKRLDERYMDSLEVGFIAYARVGGAVTDAGTHPIWGLKTPVE